MKSQQQEELIKTNCKNCAFAIYDGNTQTSCAFNRIEVFKDHIKEAYDDDKEFYIIDKLCNYYRNKNFGYSTSDCDKVKQEAAISFDIIFDCSELDDESAENIDLFISNTANYYSNKVKVIILGKDGMSEDIKNKIIKLASKQKTTISICYDTNEFMHYHIIKSKANYHFIVKSSDVKLLNQNLLTEINNYLNDLTKIYIVMNNGGTHIINNYVYKSLQYREDYKQDYVHNINLIVGMSKEQNLYTEI